MSADQPQQQYVGHNSSTQAAVLAPAAITLTLSLLLYATRIRARRSSPFIWTDGMIAAALTLAISDFVLIAISCHYGLGRHTVFVISARVVKARQFGFLTQPLCVWSICLTKCSIALTALRTRRDREWQWVFCWVIFVQTTCTIAMNVIQVVQCQPTSALWTDDVAAQCWPPERTQLAAYVTLGFSVITSLLLSLTPLTFVRGANRPLHELVALGIWVGIGLFITMSCVANMVYLHDYRTTQDPLRDMVAPTTWWQIEQNFCLIASIAIRLRAPYETLLARFGLIYQLVKMPFAVKALDHVVLTCRNINATVKFYNLLGMKHEVFHSSKDAPGVERHALSFGQQKLNLHQAGAEFEPKATLAKPGTADLCFITTTPITEVLAELQKEGLEILEEGKVVDRVGAVGKLKSVYTRDPDGNLIEVSNYV
ncbi:Glyoxalase/Bleomycin resistance protein/Dihydroxybiphenyl dioxygenase, partial [Aureobasidium melanogenum]